MCEVDEADARIADALDRGGDLRPRRVADDEHLEPLVRLRQRRGERALDQQARTAAGRDRDRHQRVGLVPGRRVPRIGAQRVQPAPVARVVRGQRPQHRSRWRSSRRLERVERARPVERAEAAIERLGREAAPAADHEPPAEYGRAGTPCTRTPASTGCTTAALAAITAPGADLEVIGDECAHPHGRARPEPDVPGDVRARVEDHAAVKRGVMAHQRAAGDEHVLAQHARRTDDGQPAPPRNRPPHARSATRAPSGAPRSPGASRAGPAPPSGRAGRRPRPPRRARRAPAGRRPRAPAVHGPRFRRARDRAARSTRQP